VPVAMHGYKNDWEPDVPKNISNFMAEQGESPNEDAPSDILDPNGYPGNLVCRPHKQLRHRLGRDATNIMSHDVGQQQWCCVPAFSGHGVPITDDWGCPIMCNALLRSSIT
jgi:hypothetical protein